MSSKTAPLILCPLQFEYAALKRVAELCHAEIDRSGPGPDAIDRWFSRRHPANRTIILAGLAGALREEFASGSAHVVSVVRSADETWQTSWPVDMSQYRQVSVISTLEPLSTPSLKRAAASRLNADLVDQESEPFVKHAERLGCSWLIVRGVSDDVHSCLPPKVSEWVDESGRTRVWRVAAALARRPRLVPNLIRLQKASQVALQGVGKHLEAILQPEV